MSTRKIIAIIAIVVVAAGGVAFAAYKHGQNTANVKTTTNYSTEADDSEQSSKEKSEASNNENASSPKISHEKAKNIAIKRAIKSHGIDRTTITDLEIESDENLNGKVWEVSFNAQNPNGNGMLEFEYEVTQDTGTVVFQNAEVDHDTDLDDRYDD